MKTRLLTTLFLIFNLICGFTQGTELLVKYYDTSLPDDERVKAGIDWAYTEGKNDVAKGIEITQEIYSGKFKVEKRRTLLVAENVELKLIAHRDGSDLLSLVKSKYEQSVANKDNEATAYWAYVLAHQHQLIDEYNESIKLYLESIDYYDKIGDTLAKGRIYTQMSWIQQTINDIDAAIATSYQGIEIFEMYKDTANLINLYARLCDMYLNTGDTAQAKYVIDYAEDLAAVYDDPYWKHFVRSPKSDFLVATEDYNGALKLLLQSLEYDKTNLADRRPLSFVYAQLCQLYLLMGQPREAVKAGEAGLKVALDNDLIKERIDNLSVLHEAYYENGNYQKAYEIFRDYTKENDEVRGAQSMQDVNAQLQAYEHEKEAFSDSLSQAKKDFEAELAHQEELSGQKRQKYVIGSIVVLLIIGGGALFLVFKRTKKHNKELAAQKQIVETQKNEIVDSIRYAKRIQSAILPPDKVVKASLENSFVLYKPKDIVAGDFYWMQAVGEKIIFAAADCTGHGVPGALVSVVCHNALNRSVKEFKLTDPAKILDKTRELIITEFEKSDDEVKDGMDIAICVLEGQTIHYAGAHNPLWVIRKGEFESTDDKNISQDGEWSLLEIKADKQPVGLSHKVEAFTSHSMELQEDDRIYIFSDGYSDQFGGDQGKKFKTKAFKQLLLSVQHLSMEDQKKIIDVSFEEWKGGIEQLDDVCVIGVRI